MCFAFIRQSRSHLASDIADLNKNWASRKKMTLILKAVYSLSGVSLCETGTGRHTNAPPTTPKKQENKTTKQQINKTHVRRTRSNKDGHEHEGLL